jgi:hypothetical protein
MLGPPPTRPNRRGTNVGSLATSVARHGFQLLFG